MNILQIQTKTILKPDSLRHLSSTLARSAKKRTPCGETDCCGNPINVEPKPTVYMERSCQPCSFFTWKPKIPILQSAPPLVGGRAKPFKKKHCYAGMKLPKGIAEIKAEAAECYRKCGAKPVCLPPPPPPVVKEEPDCEPPIPMADWDCSFGQKKPSKDHCDDIE